MPSVLFLNRVYPPDDGATGQLLAELAESLVATGWSVTILAAGTKTGDQRPETRDQQQASAARPPVSRLSSLVSSLPAVARVRSLPFTRASFIRRALSYASLYPAMLWRGLRLPRHDVVVTLTDPPLIAFVGALIRLFKRSKAIHWAQDIYPELAEELGVLRPRSLPARVLRAISTWALRRHTNIVAVGECMRARLMARGLSPARIITIPNWPVGPAGPETRDKRPETRDRRLETENIGDASAARPQVSSLSVMYSGNFGLAHRFESIVAAIKILDREAAPIRFIMTGSGPRYATVRDQLTGCANVEFRPPVPLSELDASLASADVHLAAMRSELSGLVVPSKVYGVLAAGKPCVFIGPSNSEAAFLISSLSCGRIFSDTSDGTALANCLRSWSTRPPDFLELTRHALTASREISRKFAIRQWTQHLAKSVSQ